MPRSNKKKKKNHCSTPSSSAPPLAVDAPTPSSPAPAELPSPTPATSSPISEHSFSILYGEGDLNFICEDANVLAKTAIEKATALGVANICKSLQISEADLTAFASFPTNIGPREFTVREWLSLGKQPFITLWKKPNAGLLPERDEVKEKLKQANDAKEQLVRDDLQSLSISECKGCSELRASITELKASLAECKGCGELRASLTKLMQRNSELARSTDELTNSKNLMNGQIQDLQKVVAAMFDQLQVVNTRSSQILRQIVIQDARTEAVRRLGDKTKDITNYHDYLTSHELQALALGVSPKLLGLLKDGTWGLNKADRIASNNDKAHAIMELDGALQESFIEAFEFAYQESISTYWSP